MLKNYKNLRKIGKLLLVIKFPQNVYDSKYIKYYKRGDLIYLQLKNTTR